MRGLLALIAVTALVVAVPAAAAGRAEQQAAPPTACAAPTVTPAYAGSVRRALSAKQDIWGNALIARKDGPTYASVQRLLKPLLFARARRGTLTWSGVYYLPFGQPLGVRGAHSVALHVADGSEIIGRSARGPSLKVFVGAHGDERYGSCLDRLTPARLASGYLPILETQYVDAAGNRYRQESFAVRGLRTGQLVSFVRLISTARSASGALLRFAAGGGAGPARTAQGAASFRIAPGESRTVYEAWLLSGGPPVPIDQRAYDDARARLVDFWAGRLGTALMFDVPEGVVRDAERSLLVQELSLTWRYSVGNPYEEFSFPEALDAAEVLSEYGLPDVTREILQSSLSRFNGGSTNWGTGERLTAEARYVRLSGDRAYLDAATPNLKRLVESLGRQILRRHGGGLLRKERFSSDIATPVFGLHAQAAVWQGLNVIADVWQANGKRSLARRAHALADRLGAALRRAVRASEHRLKDGSLFVPAALLADHQPFDPVTASRPGSYWNLVMPYALSSGLFPPHGREASGILAYMLEHGSRLLGLVRSGAYSLYGKPRYPVSGTNGVYGLNVARFLADNDRPDQLVLSLYGMLGAGMTPRTFVSGEAATVAPLRGAAYRSMYMPPNSASNSAFLETLRLMLVHETLTAGGRPAGLELAYSTPKGWLGDGKTIAVNAAPTSFGTLSYDLHRSGLRVAGTVELPSRRPAASVHLRLRLPRGLRIAAVRVDGRRRPVDRRSGTIDLSGLRGTLGLVVALDRG